MAMKSSLNSPRSLLRRGKLLILSNLKIRRAVNLRPALRQLFSKIVHQLWRRMVVELFGSSEGEFFLLPWREKAMMRGHNRHPHLHPLPSRERKRNRGGPILETAWISETSQLNHYLSPIKFLLNSCRFPQFAGRLSLVTTLSVVNAMGIGCMVGPDYVRPVVEQPLYFNSQAVSGEAPLMGLENGGDSTAIPFWISSSRALRRRTRLSGRRWLGSTKPARLPSLPSVSCPQPFPSTPGSYASVTPGTGTARERASGRDGLSRSTTG